MLLVSGLQAQNRSAAPALPSSQDLAILQNAKHYQSLPCRVHVSHPVLWFDFRFHVLFEGLVPNEELKKEGELLRLVARLTPDGKSGKPRFFVRNYFLKPILEEHKDRFTGVRGVALTGEGVYRLEWFIRDSTGRVCHESRKIRARRGRADRKIQMRLQAGQAEFQQGSQPWSSTEASEGGGLHLKLLLNLPPFKDPFRRLHGADVEMFLYIVDAVASDPRVGSLDIVGFNLQDGRVVFRQENARVPDLNGLYKSFETLTNQEVHVSSLRKNVETEYFTQLLQKEVTETDSSVDAVVFVGPRSPLKQQIPKEVLDQLSPARRPVHYLKYRFTEHGANWRDGISPLASAGGGEEFPILHPRDLWKSVQELLASVKQP